MATNEEQRAPQVPERESQRDLSRSEYTWSYFVVTVTILAALWSTINLIMIWPVTETSTLTVRIASASPNAYESDSGGVNAGSDTTLISRHWTGPSELFLCPINLKKPFTADVRVLILTILSGALGASIHVFSSIGGYVGNRTFRSSWIMWYLVRMPTGALLGLFITFALHGGIPLQDANVDGANPFQICFVAGLAGMFARNALDKLEDVFETLFKTQRNEHRKDNMSDAG